MTEHEAFAVELTHLAGAAVLPLFRAEGDEQTRAAGGGFDPATRDAEAAIRRAIAARWPDHGVIGEHYGDDRPDAGFVWVIDPLNGARAFNAGLPLWTTLIALRHHGRPVVGAIAQPWLDEVFLGGPSGGRLLKGGEPVRGLAVRPCPRLTEAMIATTDPELFTGAELGAWTQVRAAARLAQLGCGAYAGAMLALGRIDLVIESALKPWDWTALVPVIEAAGGQVGNWRGETPDNSGQIVACGDVRARDEALVALRRSAA